MSKSISFPKLKKLGLYFLLMMVWVGCQTSTQSNQASDELTTFILIRHAEKVNDGSDDPLLNEKGSHRAQILAKWLSNTELAAIYSTPYQRNKYTVVPVAAQHNLAVKNYDPQSDPSDFLRNVMDEYKGKKVLVCGHSNTIPAMLNTLVGEDRYNNLSENEYNHVFIATTEQLGEATVVNLQMNLENLLFP